MMRQVGAARKSGASGSDAQARMGIRLRLSTCSAWTSASSYWSRKKQA